MPRRTLPRYRTISILTGKFHTPGIGLVWPEDHSHKWGSGPVTEVGDFFLPIGQI